MPGVLLHLIAGCAMFFIGRYYFESYFDGDGKTNERLLLVIVCLLFSCAPDFFLGAYYTTHVLPFNILVRYHSFLHVIISPTAIAILLILKYRVDIKREPIWAMGLWCLVLHIAMDWVIPETGVLI